MRDPCPQEKTEGMNEQTNNASDSPAVDPVTRFESITPPEQDQDFPGLDTELDPCLLYTSPSPRD